MSTPNYRRSLRLLQIEAVLTAMMFAMPIFTIFFKDEIGLSYAQIGLSQAVFTIPLLTLNIASGWIADAFSLKLPWRKRIECPKTACCSAISTGFRYI
jgi:hypothetical protein